MYDCVRGLPHWYSTLLTSTSFSGHACYTLAWVGSIATVLPGGSRWGFGSDAKRLQQLKPLAESKQFAVRSTGHINIYFSSINKFREVLFIGPICVYGIILLARGVDMRLWCLKKNWYTINAYWGLLGNLTTHVRKTHLPTSTMNAGNHRKK